MGLVLIEPKLVWCLQGSAAFSRVSCVAARGVNPNTPRDSRRQVRAVRHVGGLAASAIGFLTLKLDDWCTVKVMTDY